MANTNEMGALNTEGLNQVATAPLARRLPPLRIVDGGKVRLGAQGPVFRKPAIADSGKVRLGAQGPIFR